MKITILQGAFLPVPALRGGAVEKVWFLLGKQFAARGHEVTHVSCSFPGLPSQEFIDGVRHIRVRGHTAKKSLAYRLLLDLFYTRRAIAALPPADILVSNTFWLPIIQRNLNKGIPYVHVARYPKGQLRHFSKHAILQTVSTPILQAILKELPDAQERTSLIPYPLAQDFIQAYEGPKEKVILYAGRVHPEKGIALLIKAFQDCHSQLPDWRLRIVGPHELSQGGGGADYLSDLQQLAQGSRTEFIGPKFQTEELRKEYETASIFVYPSLAEKGETFGLALLEAMSRQTMPICSDLDCFKDFIKDGCNGFIFNHRHENAARQLSELLSRTALNHELRDKLALRAKESSSVYTPAHITDLFIEDFARRISHRSPR